MIRADAAFAVSTLSHFLANPSKIHLIAIIQILRYLYSSRFLTIVYGAPIRADALTLTDILIIISDALFIDDVELRRSLIGYIILLFGGLIIQRAARQDIVSTSIIEAELLALAHVGKEIMALMRLFEDIQLDIGQPWKIFCDNQQTIRLVVQEGGRVVTKLRHVDIQNMWLRQEHQKSTFKVVYLLINKILVDGLTKNLPRYKYKYFRALLNLQDIRSAVESATQPKSTILQHNFIKLDLFLSSFLDDVLDLLLQTSSYLDT